MSLFCVLDYATKFVQKFHDVKAGFAGFNYWENLKVLLLLDLAEIWVKGSLINASSNHVKGLTICYPDFFLTSSESLKNTSKTGIFGFDNLRASTSPSRIHIREK